MIDSHAHLDLGPRPAEELVAAAARAGVRRIVTVGTDPASCRVAIATAERHPGVFAAVGHHPNAAESFDDAVAAELAELAAHPRCVAVGETGLDYHRDHASGPAQLVAFRAQVELARAVGKPLVVHTRDAAQDTLALLAAEAGNVSVLLHCFGLVDDVETCVRRGWWFSFAGNLTYPSAEPLRRAAAAVPGDRLLVETDSPYLAPQPVRGRPNEPAHVVHTAERLALVRGVDPDELAAQLERNAAALFGW